jgi:hypothetical protein
MWRALQLTAVHTVQIVITGAITGTVFVTLPVNVATTGGAPARFTFGFCIDNVWRSFA